MAGGPAYGAWVLLNVSLPVPGLNLAGWQWIFFLNVPAGLVTLVLLYVVAGGVETPKAPGRLDLVGALLVSLALLLAVGAPSLGGQRGGGGPPLAGGPGGGAGAPPRPRATAGGARVGGSVWGRLGERLPTVAGVVLGAAGLWLALGWEVGTELPRLQRDLGLFGAGFGLTVSPRATAAVEAAGASAYGVASAMLQITRTIGMSVGLALLTSIGQNRIDELNALINDPARRDALVVTLGHPG